MGRKERKPTPEILIYEALLRWSHDPECAWRDAMGAVMKTLDIWGYEIVDKEKPAARAIPEDNFW